MRWLLFPVSLIALTLSCGTELNPRPDSVEGTSSENADAKASLSESDQGQSNTHPIVVSAKDLKDEHRKNHLRFSTTYKGKWLEIRGAVRHIDEDFIHLDELYPASLKLLPAQPFQDDPRMVASVGEPLTLTCLLKSSSQLPTSIRLEGCHIPQ